MNRFFTLLLAACYLTAVGQNTNYIFDSQLEDQGWELLLERQGQQYWLLNQDYTWEESMAICTSLGGYLYWPNSSAEHFDVWSQVEHGVDSVQYWTGIHQDFELVDCNSGGGWVGPDGTPQQFFDWYPGEPSNYNGGESVVQFEWGPVGIQWNDAPGQQCDSLNQDPYNIRESRIIMERSKDAGCTDSTAWNYDETATIDDGSCLLGSSFCGPGTIWDAVSLTCIVANPADINLDGCVQLNDLLDLLTAYGDCGAEESAWQCGDPLEYQGYDYATIQIGEQCWFAENTRYLPAVSPVLLGSEDDGMPHAYVYGYDGANTSEAVLEPNYQTYGGLYNYEAVQAWGLCPVGWSIPNQIEWDILTTNNLVVDCVSTSWFGTNLTGLDFLPGGDRDGIEGDNVFVNEGYGGLIWLEGDNPESPIEVGVYGTDWYIYGVLPTSFGLSVRCIKDAE